jgi:DNA-binding MarR family transcriptional regulator
MPARSSQPTDPAVRVWTAMYEFVAAQDRRKPLRNVLDLGPGKVALLVMLADGPMTLRDIAAAFGIDAPAATVTIDKLQARGLVKRTPHPDDNRRKLVHLTDPGREAAARGQQILTEPPAALAALPPKDLAQLEKIMSRLDRMPPSQPTSPDRRHVGERPPTPTLIKTRKS